MQQPIILKCACFLFFLFFCKKAHFTVLKAFSQACYESQKTERALSLGRISLFRGYQSWTKRSANRSVMFTPTERRQPAKLCYSPLGITPFLTSQKTWPGRTTAFKGRGLASKTDARLSIGTEAKIHKYLRYQSVKFHQVLDPLYLSRSRLSLFPISPLTRLVFFW